MDVIVFIVEELIRFCPPLMAVFSLPEVSSTPPLGLSLSRTDCLSVVWTFFFCYL